MSPQPEIGGLADVNRTEIVLRKVQANDMYSDLSTREPSLNPHALKFDPDLSLHREIVITQMGSTAAREYPMPPSGAVEVPLEPLLDLGAKVKATPHNDEPILGPAHASVFGIALPKPSPTERAAIRDKIIETMVWRSAPEL